MDLTQMIDMLGGKDFIKSQASQITNVLEDMKTENENIPNSCDTVYINVYKRKDEPRINFAYVNEDNEMVVYEKYTVETIMQKSQMIGVFVPVVENMLTSIEEANKGDKILLSILNVKNSAGEKETKIRFTNNTRGEVIQTMDFIEVLSNF